MSNEQASPGEPAVIGAALSPDPELAAINSLIGALSPLDTEARSRVVAYVFRRLGVEVEASTVEPQAPRDFHPSVGAGFSPAPRTVGPDIRSFANEKQPITAIERTAVVAFYLAEVAPDGEKQRSIGQEEVTKYFKQAGFPLPASPTMALVHAKNAGFFEIEGAGQYRLNAVGYNLVAHRMPKEATGPSTTRRPKPTTSRAGRKSRQSQPKTKALPAPKTAVKKK